MRWSSLLTLCVVVGCTGGADETTGASSTGGSGTTAGTETAATTTTTGVGTEGSGSVSAATDLTTWATTAASASSSSSTTVEPTASASATVTVSGAPTSELTTDEPTTTGDTGDTGGDLCSPKIFGDPCVDDSDCAIAGDCCSCVAYNPMMGSPGNCGGNCKQDRCSEWGLTEGACEAGVCVVKGKSCNPNKVSCELVPPECPDGSLPQVLGDCFTGECLPIDACDWVPDCGLCVGSICNITEGPGCTHRRCIPSIAECEGQPYCECLGAIFCQPPHEQCSQDGDALVCSI